MPAVSMVVCLYREREFLSRLLAGAEGCYDDLVVVHDGPDVDDVRSLVEARGGRFFERPRWFAHESHFVFAWKQCRHDWIFRPDADEFPSPELTAWFRDFRAAPEPPAATSGFEFIFPLWNGSAQATSRWPFRQALFNRQRIRFVGLSEQWFVTDGKWERVPLVLCHQPNNPNYGVDYLLRMAKRKRWLYATVLGLMRPPSALECWRWEDTGWPAKWEAIRRRPLRTALTRLFISSWGNATEMIRSGEPFKAMLLLHFPLHHWINCMTFRAVQKEWVSVQAEGLEPGGMVERGGSPQRIFILDAPEADARWEAERRSANHCWIVSRQPPRDDPRRINELRARVLMRLDDLLVCSEEQAAWAEEFLCRDRKQLSRSA